LLHIIQVLPVNRFLQGLKLTSKQAVMEKSGPAMHIELQHWLATQQLSQARIHLHVGVVAEEIQSLCRELKAELLVTGCTGQPEHNRNVASNTAERLLMLVPADLLVLKPDLVQL
jgi:nucleotide-binding universal stress UspA family protein